nr:unnamed protein product [Callosobruchus analis]
MLEENNLKCNVVTYDPANSGYKNFICSEDNCNSAFKNSQTHDTSYFYCNRSGKTNSYSAGHSKKNEALRAKDHASIQYFYKHYGHEVEVQHVRISKVDRESLASKLILGGSVSNLLNTSRNAVCVEDKLNRVDLLVNKGINNIKSAYNISISDGCRHKDDATSVHLFVSECSESDLNPVVHYKPQGHIKEKVGEIKAKVFMSDIAPAFYNAWCITMGPVQYRLLCAWHVDRCWQINLNKIVNKDQKQIVYKTLKYMQYFLDEDKFEKESEKFEKYLNSNNSLADFQNYFLNSYYPIRTQWAYAYQKLCNINTNTYLESMHQTLKYFYFDGKKSKEWTKVYICSRFLLGIKQ